MCTTIEMPKYQSIKKVWALKIKEIQGIKTADERVSDGAIITPAEEGYGEFEVSQEYLDKHHPQAGGYYVVYKDGYTSYSPAKAFEEGHILFEEIDNPYFSFSCILAELEAGKKVARKGWNGKGMWLVLINNGCPSDSFTGGSVDLGEDGIWAIDSFIGMKTADNKFVPWLASQTDILAKDWEVVDEN